MADTEKTLEEKYRKLKKRKKYSWQDQTGYTYTTKDKSGTKIEKTIAGHTGDMDPKTGRLRHSLLRIDKKKALKKRLFKHYAEGSGSNKPKYKQN